MIFIDFLENKIIIIDSLSELKSSHISQLNYWGFHKSSDNITYQTMSHITSKDSDFLLLKILKYFDNEEIFYSLSPTSKNFISEIYKEINKVKRIRELGKAYKDGDVNQAEFKKFVSFINDKIPRKLKNHQIKAAFHQYMVINTANFSVPGSGKTTVALCNYEKLKLEDKVNILFVVGPAACFGPWRKEFEVTLGRQPNYKILAGGEQVSRKLEYFSPLSKKAELYLTTYQTLSNDQNEVIKFFCQKGINIFLVIDEAHYIKQIGGIWANAVLSLSKFAKYRCILTGTPFPKSYTDVFNLFDFLWPNNNPLDSEIKTRIKIYEERGDNKLVKNLLHDRLGPFFYRVRKSELGLIPPKFHSPYIMEMNKYEKMIYQAIEEKISSYAKQDYLKNIDLVMKLIKGRIIRLRQCVSYAKLLSTAIDDYDEKIIEDESDLKQIIYNYDNVELPAKLIFLKEIVDNLQKKKQKVVIWANFILTLELIVKYFSEEGLYCKLIYGKTPIEQTYVEEEETREKIRNEFVDPNSKLDILVANPAACAESISLHKTCFHAIYYDLSYNCAQYLQSLDRIHRVGGSEKHQANYYFLQYRNTIDQDIKANLDRKAIKMYDIIEQDYNIYSLDMFEEDEDIEAYNRLFTN